MPAVLLIQLALKAFAVLAVAWVIVACMWRASASARHLVWTIGLVATLALPLVRVLGPTWQVSVPESAWVVAAAPAADTVLRPAAIQEDAPFRASDATPNPESSPATSAIQETGDRRQEAAAASGAGAWDGIAPWTVGLALWAAGALCLIARLGYGLFRANRIAEQATEITDEGWLMTFDAAAAMLRVDRPVMLRASALTSVPVACGLWRASILLPADAIGWSEERRLVVLLHELAHIRRRDCLVQAMAQLTCALHWINPLAHVALARLRAEQERACDDLVLEAGTDAPVYADHLFEIARSFRAPAAPAWATLAMARPSQLEGRLMAILDERCNRAPLARRARLIFATTATAGLVALGALHVTAAAGSAPEPDAAAVINAAQAQGDAIIEYSPNPNIDRLPSPRPNPAPSPRAAAFADDQLPPAPPPPPAAPGSSTVSDETRRRVADALATALNDDNVAVREEALNGLASMRDARAVPALLRALRDPNADLREQALSGLAQFDTPEALDGLVSALKDASPDVREHAVRHVGAKISRGRIEVGRHTDTFIALLRDETSDVRESAAMALGMSRDTRAIPALTAALKDAQVDVRERAASALGSIGDPAAIDALTAALKDASPDVREEAATALARIARGERRGIRPVRPVVPVPPVPPGRPLAGASLNEMEIGAIARQAMESVKDMRFDFNFEFEGLKELERLKSVEKLEQLNRR
jgi:HEAT repeat protein/beta-lactamase regulating signal transducer with metallopeptidase domain